MTEEPDGLIEGRPMIPGMQQPQQQQPIGAVMVEVGSSGNYNVTFNNLMVEAVPTILRKAANELEKKLLE